MFPWFLCTLAPLFLLSANATAQNESRGEVVKELHNGVMYVHQAKNGDYWFGSNDFGVYRYDGKTLTNFTTKDGLASNRIRGVQEDKYGSVYFTTYEGISKFDGKSITTLQAPSNADPKDWKLRPDDLWFVGPPDAGVVFRYDGESLHPLEFPKTKLGDEHFEKMPRDKFPNAIYSPYDVYCIVRDSKGHLWFGSTCIGVCRYDGKEFDWLTDPTLLEAPVRSIHEDRKGNLWFTYWGETPFEGYRATIDFGKRRKGAEGNIITGMSILEDGDGNLWTAALRAGAFKHDGKQKTSYSIKDGETTVDVFAVYRDNRGDIWLGTNNSGAYRFNGKSFEKWRP